MGWSSCMGAVDGFEICIAHLTFRRDTGSVDVSASELRIAPRHVDGISAAASGGVASTSFAGLGPTFGPRIGMVGRSVRSTTEFIATMDRTFLRANVTELVQCSHITPRAGHSCNKPVATMPGRKRKRDVVPKTDAALSVSPLVALLRSGDLSILGAIKHELPEVFAAEILPKLDMEATLNLAQVNKFYNDAVWSVEGVRSLEPKIRAFAADDRWQNRGLYAPQHSEPMYWAVRFGNAPAVRALLESGVGVNDIVDEAGTTALDIAAAFGQIAAINALIDAGADLNTQSDGGGPPMCFAAESGSTAAVMALIHAGADMNVAKLLNGYTPLHLAVCQGSVACTAVLIQAGADISIVNDDDMTPLDIIAVNYGPEEEIAKLLRVAANFHAKIRV